MNVFTGYFEKVEDYISRGLVSIGIAGKSPCNFNGLEYKELAPKRFIYDNYIQSGDSEAYSKDYFYYVLDKLDAEVVLNELKQLANNKDFILLCYEKPNQFCHRHLVAYWLKSELGIELSEL